MKRVIPYLIILALAISNLNRAKAQTAIYTSNSGLSIGFGIGASYQQSDIANSMGTGLDLRLGSNLYQKDNALLAVDWRFRFLGGENQAYDHRINTDLTYSNIRYSFMNYDLELSLTLNRLRERTRIIISGFIGAGLTYGRTFTDLYDADNILYNFSGIDPTMSKKDIKTDLMDLSDKDFETSLNNKLAFIPTAGLFLGYQFSHRFSMGIEHKVNFSLNEENATMGIDIDNNIMSESPMDIMHYTSLAFKWSFGKRSSGKSNIVYPSIERSPITHNKISQVKAVDHTKPGRTADKIDLSQQLATSRVTNVVDPVRSTRNETVIAERANPVTLANEDSNRTQIVNNNNKTGDPGIRFVNPAAPLTVGLNIFLLKAQTTNVGSWQDVTVLVNGKSISNFSFSRDGMVTSNIGLKEGINNIEIKGKNQALVASGKTSITYKKVSASVVTTADKEEVEEEVEIVEVVEVVEEVVEIVEVVEEVEEVVEMVEVVEEVEIVEVVEEVEKPVVNCGVRINPGNSQWQFCLVTPSGKFNRDNLKDANFAYSGSASSLYIKPIGGGGDAIVNGKAYKLKSGSYYLFTGSLSVKVSTKNPGSMGQWSVCITSNKAPKSGNGNNRPQSPCEK